jgi:hypothetical protein
METAIGDFRLLWHAFTMEQLEQTVSDVSTAVEELKSTPADVVMSVPPLSGAVQILSASAWACSRRAL